MTNIGNELGQVLNSVLTTAEGAGLEELCQGIVRRYQNAGEPEPEVIYVDRDCCSQSGEILKLLLNQMCIPVYFTKVNSCVKDISLSLLVMVISIYYYYCQCNVIKIIIMTKKYVKIK